MDPRTLGLDRDITRRDFLKGTLIGSGALLLEMPAPLQAMNAGTPSPASPGDTWTGYAGVGDYARSNGVQEWFGGVENASRAMKQVMEAV